MSQQVISPFIAEARVERALLAQLLGKLELSRPRGIAGEDGNGDAHPEPRREGQPMTVRQKPPVKTPRRPLRVKSIIIDPD